MYSLLKGIQHIVDIWFKGHKILTNQQTVYEGALTSLLLLSKDTNWVSAPRKQLRLDLFKASLDWCSRIKIEQLVNQSDV